MMQFFASHQDLKNYNNIRKQQQALKSKDDYRVELESFTGFQEFANSIKQRLKQGRHIR